MADAERDQKTSWVRAQARAVAWRRPWPWQALLAEWLGALLYTFFGCCAAVSTNSWGFSHAPRAPDAFAHGDTYHVDTSLGFGVALGACVGMFQTASGAHLNPAVTVGLLLARRLNLVLGLLYIPAQLAGGVAGAALLKLVMGQPNARDDVSPTLLFAAGGHALAAWQGLLWEVLLAFHLTLSYLVASDGAVPHLRFMSPLTIGMASIVNHLAALYATGGCANPARTLGAGVMSATYADIWVYILGPPIGGALAAGFHCVVLRVHANEGEN